MTQSKWFRRIATAALLLAPLFLAGAPQSAFAQRLVKVTLKTDKAPGPGALHGIRKVEEALRAKGIVPGKIKTYPATKKNTEITIEYVLFAGLAKGGGRMEKWFNAWAPVEAESLKIAKGPEEVSVQNKRGRFTLGWGKSTEKRFSSFFVTAADDRGLMYALLDIADRIGWAKDPLQPFSEIREIEESPYTPERALSMYTMHKSTFESYFHDEKFWERYLDMAAKNRYNTFALLFGYENHGYFAPPYPQLFDVPGFPDIRVTGMTKERQQRNLDSLNRIIRMTHERGLNFTLGIWDHIYRGGVQGPTSRAEKPTEGVIWGLTADNLTDYTVAGLRELIKKVPNLDAIQFRMHGESGLKRGEMGSFWESVYKVMNDEAPGVRFDARAKNYPHALIDKALEMGVNLRIDTKYWMEQMGLPFHPTHIPPQNQRDRRHGYADLLRYPKQYDIHWRLWNSGTSRVLLWGDPEYAARFAQSTHLYDGKGFEVNDPLSTKMQDQPHGDAPFDLLNPKYKYYDWEFERYWHFYQVFGRMGYNPETPPEVWEKEFEQRFGPFAAPYVEQALHTASGLLPRIVAYCYPYNHFPTTRGWAARQRQEDLPVYARSEGSDTQQFLSPDEAARNILANKNSAKILPSESAEWFNRTADEVLKNVVKAEKQVGHGASNELLSTMADMRILAHLARYHARRARAAVQYSLFKHSGDLNSLDKAIQLETEATAAWADIVKAAADFYPDDIRMGRRSADLCGHWSDELIKLQKGLEKLKKTRDEFKPKSSGDKPRIASAPVRRVSTGSNLLIHATLSGPVPIVEACVFYAAPGEPYKTHELKPLGKAPRYGVEIILAADMRDTLRYYIEVVDKKGNRATWPKNGKANPIEVAVTDDTKAPSVKHKAIESAPPNEPLEITARVSDPSGVRSVRLRYRPVTQFEDYKTLEMTLAADGAYKATVPGKEIVPEWDFMYFIEVVDQKGNGAIYPDLEKEAPYVMVKLRR